MTPDPGDHPTRPEGGALAPFPAVTKMIDSIEMPPKLPFVGMRVVVISCWAIVVGIMGGFAAVALKLCIGFFTNLAFYGRWSLTFASPANNHLGWLVLLVPVAGGVIVGLMARYGSQGIRGHGLPEAMEQVLSNQSRIQPRLTWLKPLSAAIAIGTGGPFGAEGPIIASGAALGSLVGQWVPTSAGERKALLAAGAAAGMAATFGSPVSAVLLAVELLLFEFRPQSLIPVALASAVADVMHTIYEGSLPMFPVPDMKSPSIESFAAYVLLGAAVGVAAVWATRTFYKVEDLFRRLPVHWMWWPAIGGLAVGAIGYVAPHTLGVGYDNITSILSNHLLLGAVLALSVFKWLSWTISLGSGTSGGTLAPLFTIGGGLGLAIGLIAERILPGAGIDPRVAALVGMAAMFAGATRAVLTSIVFAFETTMQPLSLLPLLGGCTAAYLISCLMMRQTIMTGKVEQRGVHVPGFLEADPLNSALVREAAAREPVVLRSDWSAEQALEWIKAGGEARDHHGYPIVDDEGHLLGFLTRKELALASLKTERLALGDLLERPPVAIYDDCTLREAVDHMARHHVGRLPVLMRSDPTRLIGIISRSDIFAAYRAHTEEAIRAVPIGSAAGAKNGGQR